MADVSGSSIDFRVTSLLTEHFGFPPLALVDDVINAVNEIMYKCTLGVESYLQERKEHALKAGKDSSDVFRLVTSDEIKIGTAKLETLLESQVDRNFDKFELYTLRNIFTLPHDLVEDGWIKLKHHEGIEFTDKASLRKLELDEKISSLVNNIRLEAQLRKILKLQIIKARKVIKILRLFRNNLVFLSQKVILEEGNTDNTNSSKPQLSPKAREALKSLSPIDETLYFLLQQVDDLISQTNRLSEKLKLSGSNQIQFLPNLRDRYIDSKSMEILQQQDKGQDDAMDVDQDGEHRKVTEASFRILDDGGAGIDGSQLMRENFLPSEVLLSQVETLKSISQSLRRESDKEELD